MMTISCHIYHDIFHLERQVIEMNKVIYGNKIRTSNEDINVFSKEWEEFLKNKSEGDIYAVYSNYESNHTGSFDFMIGTEEKSGQHSITIPNGEYYMWEVESNDLNGVGEAWYEIWQSDLPRAFATDFEVYKRDGSIVIYLSIVASV